MSFVNTIDQLGDDVVFASIVDGSITEFKDDVLKTIGRYAFYQVESLVNVDLPTVTSIGDHAFYGCSSLTTLILRSAIMCTLDIGSLSGTQIASSKGYIYVPRALVDSYKSSWSSYTSRFRAIEDYPNICG